MIKARSLGKVRLLGGSLKTIYCVPADQASQNYSTSINNKTMDFLQRIELCQNNGQLKNYLFSGQVQNTFSSLELSSIALELMKSSKVREQRCGILLSISQKTNTTELKDIITQKSGIERMSGYLIAHNAHLLFSDEELVQMLQVNKLTHHIRSILVKRIAKKKKHLIKQLLDDHWDAFSQQHLFTLISNLRSISTNESAEYFSRLRLQSSDKDRIAKKNPEAYLEYIINKIQRSESTLKKFYEELYNYPRLKYKLIARLGNPFTNLEVQCIKYIGEEPAFQLFANTEPLIARSMEIISIGETLGDKVAARLIATLIKRNEIEQMFSCYSETETKYLQWRRIWNIVLKDHGISEEQLIQLLCNLWNKNLNYYGIDTMNYLELDSFPFSIAQKVSQIIMDASKNKNSFMMLDYLNYQDLDKDENFNLFLSYCNDNNLEIRIQALQKLLKASVYQQKRTNQVLEYIHSKIEENFKHSECLFNHNRNVYLQIFENMEHAKLYQRSLDLCFKTLANDTCDVFLTILTYSNNNNAIDYVCNMLQKPKFKSILNKISIESLPPSIKERLSSAPFFNFLDEPYLKPVNENPELRQQFVKNYFNNGKHSSLAYIDLFPEKDILELLKKIPEKEYSFLFSSAKFKKRLEEHLNLDIIEFVYKNNPTFSLNAYSYFPNIHRKQLLEMILNHAKSHLIELIQKTDISNYEWNFIINQFIKQLAKQMTDSYEIEEFNKVLSNEFKEFSKVHGYGRDLTSLTTKMLYISKYFPFPSLSFPKIIENFNVRHLHLVLLDVSKYFEPSEFAEGVCKYFLNNLEDIDTGLEMFDNILFCVTEFVVYSPTHDVTKVAVDFTERMWRKCNGNIDRLLAVHNFAINLIYLTNDMNIFNRLEPIFKDATKGDLKLITQQISFLNQSNIDIQLNTDITVKLFNINMSISQNETICDTLLKMLNVQNLPVECKQKLVRLLFDHNLVSEKKLDLQGFMDGFIGMDWNFLSIEFNLLLAKLMSNDTSLTTIQRETILLDLIRAFKKMYPSLTSENRKILLENIIEPFKLQIRNEFPSLKWIHFLDLFTFETNWNDEKSIIEHYIKRLAQLGLQVADPMERQLVYYDWCQKGTKGLEIGKTTPILNSARIVVENTNACYSIEEQIIATGLLTDPRTLGNEQEIIKKARSIGNNLINHILNNVVIK